MINNVSNTVVNTNIKSNSNKSKIVAAGTILGGACVGLGTGCFLESLNKRNAEFYKYKLDFLTNAYKDLKENYTIEKFKELQQQDLFSFTYEADHSKREVDFANMVKRMDSIKNSLNEYLQLAKRAKLTFTLVGTALGGIMFGTYKWLSNKGFNNVKNK